MLFRYLLHRMVYPIVIWASYPTTALNNFRLSARPSNLPWSSNIDRYLDTKMLVYNALAPYMMW